MERHDQWFVHSFRGATDMAAWLNERQAKCEAEGTELLVIQASVWPDGELLLIARTVRR